MVDRLAFEVAAADQSRPARVLLQRLRVGGLRRGWGLAARDGADLIGFHGDATIATRRVAVERDLAVETHDRHRSTVVLDDEIGRPR